MRDGCFWESRETLTLLLDALPLGCVLLDAKRNRLFINEKCVTLFGCRSKQECMEKYWTFSPDFQPCGRPTAELLDLRMTEALANKSIRFEWLYRDGNGEPIPTEVRLERIDNGGQIAVVAFIRDLREQKAMRRQLDAMLKKARLDEKCFRILASHANMAVMEWTAAKTRRRVYRNVEELFAASPNEEKDYNDVIGEEIIHPDDVHAYRIQFDATRNGLHAPPIRMRLKSADGGYRWCQHTIVTVNKDNGEPYKTIGFFEDIHEEVTQEEAIRQRSQIDPLTRLHNKETSRFLIARALEDAAEGSRHAVVCLDLDNFKNINDSFGHLYGDEVLAEIAAVVRKLFRSTDILGRFGGDEFIVFVRNIPDLEFVRRKAEALCREICKTYRVGDVRQTVSASVGVAIYPDDGTTYEQLYRKADAASYTAKRAGKNRYCLNSEA